MGTSLLGSEYRTLWQAVRRPMLRWWWHVGIWLVFVMAAGCVSYTLLNYLSLKYGDFATGFSVPVWQVGSGLLAFFQHFMLPILWLWAATVCNGLISAALRRGALSEGAGFGQARFVIMYAQGLVPLGIYFLISLASSLMNGSEYFPPYTSGDVIHFASILDVTAQVLQTCLAQGMFLAWLVCLLVVLPQRPIVAWGLIIADVIGFSAVIPMIGGMLDGSPKPATYAPSPLGWIVSGAVVLALFMSLSKGRWAVARRWYYLIIAALLLANATAYIPLLDYIAPARILICLFRALPGFLFRSPFAWGRLTAWADRVFPAGDTALGQLLHLLPVIVEPLWVLGILALIYYVILGSWSRGATPGAQTQLGESAS